MLLKITIIYYSTIKQQPSPVEISDSYGAPLGKDNYV